MTKMTKFRHTMTRYDKFTGSLTQKKGNVFYQLTPATFDRIIKADSCFNRSFNCGHNWNMGDDTDYFDWLKSDSQMRYLHPDNTGDAILDFAKVKTVQDTQDALHDLKNIFQKNNPVICGFPYDQKTYMKMLVSFIIDYIDNSMNNRNHGNQFKMFSAINDVLNSVSKIITDDSIIGYHTIGDDVQQILSYDFKKFVGDRKFKNMNDSSWYDDDKSQFDNFCDALGYMISDIKLTDDFKGDRACTLSDYI